MSATASRRMTVEGAVTGLYTYADARGVCDVFIVATDGARGLVFGADA